ncbi:MAG: zinc ribbon domain-containing protein [Chloroflexi bacterium]|nr:zinc ribbon domain-containing protein [Chloroflexota bacterium]
MTCSNCRHPNPDGARFCLNCGAPIASAPPPRPVNALPQTDLSSPPQSMDARQQVTQPPPSGLDASVNSILANLAKLGIAMTKRQLIGLGASAIAGMVMARVLPYIYPIFDPILTLVFGSGASGPRDGFNTNAMTFITFLTSFLPSFFVMGGSKILEKLPWSAKR